MSNFENFHTSNKVPDNFPLGNKLKRELKRTRHRIGLLRSHASTKVTDKAKQILDSKFGPLKDDDDGGIEDFDDGSKIVELNAIEILTEHLHFYEKGFLCDSNLCMHMRAHGEQFETMEAMAKPSETITQWRATRFSCPFEGCKRNKLHQRFQSLKSVICVKNHFKRSHCPKM
ncbi:hypothetical protein GYH30_022350 [Glycine max]|nr:hypothetical protein GYH30_022350 [Glycine max]